MNRGHISATFCVRFALDKLGFKCATPRDLALVEHCSRKAVQLAHHSVPCPQVHRCYLLSSQAQAMGASAGVKQELAGCPRQLQARAAMRVDWTPRSAGERGCGWASSDRSRHRPGRRTRLPPPSLASRAQPTRPTGPTRFGPSRRMRQSAVGAARTAASQRGHSCTAHRAPRLAHLSGRRPPPMPRPDDRARLHLATAHRGIGRVWSSAVPTAAQWASRWAHFAASTVVSVWEAWC
jgi:hypothetical protein